MNVLYQSIFVFFASLGFAIVFNVKGKNLFFASLGGMIAWFIYLVFKPLIEDDIIRYFIASVAISIYSQKMAKIRKCPVLIFLVIAFIPLVPGYSIYKTMECILLSDISQFIDRALYTFKVVMSIATGCLISTSVISRISIRNR